MSDNAKTSLAECPKECPTESSVHELLMQLGTAMRHGFDTVNANVALVSNDVDIVKRRIASVEERQSDLEEWRRHTSERVRGIATQTSDADLTQAAKLADEIVARQELAKKVDSLDAKQDMQLAILTRLDSVAKNPLVKGIAQALGIAFLTWLGMRGIK